MTYIGRIHISANLGSYVAIVFFEKKNVATYDIGYN